MGHSADPPITARLPLAKETLDPWTVLPRSGRKPISAGTIHYDKTSMYGNMEEERLSCKGLQGLQLMLFCLGCTLPCSLS